MKQTKKSFRHVQAMLDSSMSAFIADEYVDRVDKAIDESLDLLYRVSQQKQNMDIGFQKGFIAEAHHVGSFNVDAAVKGRGDIFAKMLESTEDGSVDVQVLSQGGTYDYQLKYYRSSYETAKALSSEKYGDQLLVAPSEQVEDIRRYALTKEDSSFQHTAVNTHDRVEVEGVNSRPLTNEESIQLSKDLKDGSSLEGYGYSLEQSIEWGDMLREGSQAGLQAALLSSTMQMAPQLLDIIGDGIKGEGVDPQKLKEMLKTGGKGAAKGAIRGGVSAFLTIACKSGKFGAGAQQVSSQAIGMGTALAMTVVEDALLLSNDEISSEEFTYRCGRNLSSTYGAYIGAGIGQSLIPIPILGAMIGQTVGALVGGIAAEGVIEGAKVISNEEGHKRLVLLNEEMYKTAEMVYITAVNMQDLSEAYQQEISSYNAAIVSWKEFSGDWFQKAKSIQKQQMTTRNRLEMLKNRLNKRSS